MLDEYERMNDNDKMVYAIEKLHESMLKLVGVVNGLIPIIAELKLRIQTLEDGWK